MCLKYYARHAFMESMNTTSMETVSTGVLDRTKEHYLRSKDTNEFTIYNPLCQTYSPTVI